MGEIPHTRHMTTGTSIWTVLGGVAAGLAIASFLYGFFGRLFSKAVQTESVKQTADLEKRLDEKLEHRSKLDALHLMDQLSLALQPIRKELEFNSGSSLKDQSHSTAIGVKELKKQVKRYRRETDRRLGDVEFEIRRLWLPGAEAPSQEPPPP